MPYYQHLLIIGVVVVAVWCLFIYFWPRLLLSVYKRGILVKGFGDGPVPINTLYTQPPKLFAEPFTLQAASNSVTAGMNHDTLLTVGWLDLRQGPLVLHVPDMNDRYYGVQFTDPSKNTNFAYVGKRTSGTQAGDYLITGPGWKGQVPRDMTQISSPNKAVLLLGRVLVYIDSDLSTAYDLSKQIQLTPLSGWQPSQ
ncbi:MAG TPA: DUF1254 domain-containing protein [Anaerolineae bacterium]|nr:DUF1254 domain-containing protein [Anaerolineae bacterium]